LFPSWKRKPLGKSAERFGTFDGIDGYELRSDLGLVRVGAVNAGGTQTLGEIELLLVGQRLEFGTELNNRLARQKAKEVLHRLDETDWRHDPFIRKG